MRAPKVSAVCLVGLVVTLLLPNFGLAQTSIHISLALDDNIVNPRQEITISGTATQGGIPLDNRVVRFFLDNALQTPSWGQPSQAAWREGRFENTTVDLNRVRLGYKWDLDIAYRDTGHIIRYRDSLGTDTSLGISAMVIGGYGDMDADGDLDLAFADAARHLRYVDVLGNVSVTLYTWVHDVGGIADVDNDGDMDIVYIDGARDIVRVDRFLNRFTILPTTATRIGWPADLDRDNDIDIPFIVGGILRSVDRGGLEFNYGVAATEVGGVIDWDGDGDLDVAFRGPDLWLRFIDRGKNVITVAGGIKDVGGVRDFDGDGDPDAAVILLSPPDRLAHVDNAGNIVTLPPTALSVGGIADFDNDTGYLSSGTYTSATKDWQTPTIRVENIRTDALVPVGTSLTANVEVSDNENFTPIKGSQLVNVVGGIRTENLVLPIARYVRVRFGFATTDRTRTPTLISFTLNANIYTDNGKYRHVFAAPASLGVHRVRVRVENGVFFAENTATFDVRRLRFDNFRLLDNHGQVDGVLNPGENYRVLVRIREDNLTHLFNVTSGSFTATIGGTSHALKHWENSIWRTENTFIAPRSLGLHHFTVNFSGRSGENIRDHLENALYSYNVKTIGISASLDDNVVNAGQPVTLSGTAILWPGALPVVNENVIIRIGGVHENTVTTDSLGRYSHTFAAPSALGTHTVSVWIRNPQGIVGENLRNFDVKDIKITVALDDNWVNAGRRVVASGTARLLPDNRWENGETVQIWVGGTHENSGTVAENGWFHIGFHAPPAVGVHTVVARITNSRGIHSENSTTLRVDRIAISLSLSDNDVNPGQLVTASGTAIFTHDNSPVRNTTVSIWTGKAWDTTSTNENGVYSYTFAAPLRWGTYRFTVHIVHTEFTGDNAKNYEVNVIEISLSLDDNVVNPGQSMKAWGRAILRPDNIPENKRSLVITVAGVPTSILTRENGGWDHSFTAPTALGTHAIRVHMINPDNFIGDNTDNFHVRTISLTAHLDDSVVNAGAPVTVSGTATLFPGGMPVAGVEVRVKVGGVLVGRPLTNENGVYRATFPAPPKIGSYLVKSSITDGNGITGSASTTLSVKTIKITLQFNDNVVNPGQPMTAFGTATLQPGGTPIRNNEVRIWLDGTYVGKVFTDNGGNWSHSYSAPTLMGSRNLRVKTWEDNFKGEFRGENTQHFDVKTIQIVPSLSDTIVKKGQLITLTTTATLIPDGTRVENRDFWIRLPGENRLRRTDARGENRENFNAPVHLGKFTVVVDIVDAKGITGENRTIFDVRKLRFSGFALLDNHGQVDGVLNPRENYRVLVRIVENNGSEQFNVTSGSFSMTIGVTSYTLVHVSDNLWMTAKSRIAPPSLGPDNFTAVISGTSGNGIPGSISHLYRYEVKTIKIPLALDDNVVNPGDNVRLTGTAILQPDNTPMRNENVRITIGGRSENVTTDNKGRFTHTFAAPSALGAHTVTASMVGAHGIRGENSINFDVKTIRLEIHLTKAIVYGGAMQDVRGRVTLWPDNVPVRNENVRISVTGATTGPFASTTKVTDENGRFHWGFPASIREDRFTVRANITDDNGIRGENSANFWVGTPVRVSGQLLNAANIPIVSTITLFENGTDRVYYRASTDGRGNYGEWLHARRYDMKVEAFGDTIRFFGVRTFERVLAWTIVDNIVRLDNFPPAVATIGVPERLTKIKGLAVELHENLTDNFDHAILVFNFAASIGKITNVENLRIYRSDNWDMATRRGTGWVEQKGVIDRINHTITLRVTRFSAFVLAEKGPIPIEGVVGPLVGPIVGPIVGPLKGPFPVVGDLAGPIGEIQQRMGVIENALGRFENLPGVDPVELGPGAERGIDLSLYLGESTNVTIAIRNNLDLPVTLIPRARGEASRFIIFPSPYLRIDPHGTGRLDILVYAPDGAETGLYTGSVVITENLTGENMTEFPARIRVVAPAKSFLDLAMTPLTREIAPGGNIEVEITMRNVGDKPRIETRVTLQLIHLSEPRVVAEISENFVVETTLTRLMSLRVPEDSGEGNYRLKVFGDYIIRGEAQQSIALGSVTVQEPYVPLLDRRVGPVPLGVILAAAVAGIAAGTGGYLYHRKLKIAKEAKKRYEKVLAPSELPTESPTSAFIGKLAETPRKTYINLDDLTTHIMIAGATGAGKTIMAQDLVEEALQRGVDVFVFDPTAQWTGFMQKCTDAVMLRHYDKFGLKESDARGFAGYVKRVHDPTEYLNIGRLIARKRKEGEPGKLWVFLIDKFEARDLDAFTANTINDVFRSGPEESKRLKTLILYDEVHRLLPRFGGKGLGITMLERGVREFRKWGIGMVLASQVIGDFEKEIRANIRTQVQLWTRDEDELERIKEKFGPTYMQSVSKAAVGTGMVFNSDYNNGRPYFIHFRPILHSLTRLDERTIEKYDKYTRRLEDVQLKLEKLKEAGADVFDLEIEISLAEKKLEEGSFNVVDLYLESVEPRVEKECRARKIKIEKVMVTEEELKRVGVGVKKELEKLRRRVEVKKKKEVETTVKTLSTQLEKR